jgi:hypothetical protein
VDSSIEVIENLAVPLLESEFFSQEENANKTSRINENDLKNVLMFLRFKLKKT